MPGDSDYIPIESLEDIDVLKLSVRDLDKRYIDRSGNRYALRFNMKTRRPEVVQIVSNRLEARRLQQSILQEKSRPAASAQSRKEPSSLPPVIAQFVPDEETFHEQKFVDECVAELPRLRESQQAAVSKMRQSRIFENVLGPEFLDLNRNVERDAWRKIDESIAICKEWTSRPPSLHTALIRVLPEKRKVLDTISDEPVKLESIRRWEWQDKIADAYERLHKFSNEIKSLMDRVPEEELLKTPQAQRQFFKDAAASLGVIEEACAGKLSRVDGWRRRYL